MTPAASLMLLVDPRTTPPSIAGVELYSGAHPAIMPLVGITLLVGHGASYEAGIADIRRQLQPRPGGTGTRAWTYDPHGWMVALMPERTRREVGR